MFTLWALTPISAQKGKGEECERVQVMHQTIQGVTGRCKEVRNQRCRFALSALKPNPDQP